MAAVVARTQALALLETDGQRRSEDFGPLAAQANAVSTSVLEELGINAIAEQDFRLGGRKQRSDVSEQAPCFNIGIASGLPMDLRRRARSNLLGALTLGAFVRTFACGAGFPVAL